MRRILVTGLLALVAALATATPAGADTSDFTFDSFDAEYTISRADDGSSHLVVVETIVARFPDFDQNRGIVRAIPDDYDGVDLETSVQSVVDQTGAAVYYEIERDGEFLVLALGTDDFVRGVNTYVITYTQNNVVRNFADTNSDEFYWDVNGTGWDQPFDRVTATVTIAPALTPELSGNQACYVGAQNSTTQCDISGGPDGPFSASVSELSPRETMTVAVGFTPGTFVIPEATGPRGPQDVPISEHLIAGGVGLASLGGLVLAIVARRRAGGVKGTGIIIAQYSEPTDITILQSAHLVSRPSSAIPAALVRLAVRKNLRILAYPVEVGGEPYTLQYLGEERTNPEDKALLALVFGSDREPGAVREFGNSQQSLMRALTDLSSQAKNSLEPAGFEQRPKARALAIAAILTQIVLAVVAGLVLINSLSTYANVSGVLITVMVVGSGILLACIAMAVAPNQLTRKGADAREFLLGMRMYLTIAEEDRLRALQSPQGAERINVGNNQEMIKLYEKLLPWAVLWGVEDQWMRELAVRVNAEHTQPDWFVGTDGFSPTVFSSTMRGFSTALMPPPSVSTGSSWSGSSFGSFSGGSFGGGFSGGGGGGGGGGGR